ncbi:MAG TPA: GNAT family N-acetyltransferase [Phenylobacterium sp.]
MIQVRAAAESDREALLDVLLLAFSGDPCLRYTLARPEHLLKGFRGLATGLGGGGFATGGAYITEDAAAGALWLPPGVESDGEAIGKVIGELVTEEKAPVLEQVVEGMGRHHPHEPHWYLAMIGVDPVRQGEGLGSAVLKAGLARCDADGLPAYLESSNPKNIPLYERHGFEVLGVIQPGDFPPLYPMLRPARA